MQDGVGEDGDANLGPDGRQFLQQALYAISIPVVQLPGERSGPSRVLKRPKIWEPVQSITHVLGVNLPVKGIGLGEELDEAIPVRKGAGKVLDHPPDFIE